MASSSSTTPVVPSSVTTIPGSSLPSSVPSSVTTIPGLSFPSSVSTIAGSSFSFFDLPPPLGYRGLPPRSALSSPLYYFPTSLWGFVHFWLFATLSREVLLEVHLLPTSRGIWLSLHRRYMDANQAKSIELKRQLTTLISLIMFYLALEKSMTHWLASLHIFLVIYRLKSFILNFYFMSKCCSVSRNLTLDSASSISLHILSTTTFETRLSVWLRVVAGVDLLPEVMAVVANVVALVVVGSNHKSALATIIHAL
ncbi:hypothetical protein H5410_024066, partial [Solanum commersonii]